MFKRVTALVIILSVFFVLAQQQPAEAQMQAYGDMSVGAVYILPGAEIRLGLKDLGVPGLGVRVNAGIYLPFLATIGADVMYFTSLEAEQELYFGVGPRMFFAPNLWDLDGSTVSVVGAGLFAGFEDTFSGDTHYYVEGGIDVSFPEEGGAVIPKVVFGLRRSF